MHWLVDGHNLIGQMPNLHLSDPDDEEKLVDYLRRYRARTGHRLTVIFDAGQTYQPAKSRKSGGVTVQFAPYGQTADRLIMRRLRRLKNPQGTMLVSSDRAVQQVARQFNVGVVEAREFARQLLDLSAAGQAAEAGSQADVRLSADEVEEWLDIFNRPDND